MNNDETPQVVPPHIEPGIVAVQPTTVAVEWPAVPTPTPATAIPVEADPEAVSLITADPDPAEVVGSIPVEEALFVEPAASSAPVASELPAVNVIEEESKVSKKPRAPSTTVVQHFETTTPLTKEEEDQKTVLSLLTDTLEATETALNDLPNIDLADTEEGQRWSQIISMAASTVPYGNWFQSTVDREGAKFRQGVESERGLLNPYAPKFNDTEAGKLTGEKAVIRVRALLGMGGLASIPLWHSGFWITLKAPSEAKLLDLSRKLGQNKTELGRATYGLAFANTTVMFAEYVTNFVIEHIYETTLKPELQANIKEHMSILDLPVLAWGLACLVYPKGFPYVRSVLDQTTQANRTIREKLNVGKLLWEDNSAFTPWQISHMANRTSGHMTIESITRYTNDFTIGKERTVTLREGCNITIKTPSISKYLTSGRKWISSIIEMVTTAFAIENTDTNREDYIRDQGRASSMRQFSHWIESIDVKGDEYNSIETLELILNALSSEDELRTNFFEAVRKFMEDATIAIVAVPVTENEEATPYPRFPSLIPIDAMNVFFILLEQKKKSILGRD